MPPASALAAPPSTAAASAPAEARLRSFLDEARRRWTGIDPDLGDLVDAVAGLVDAGGKRLRPAAAYWAFVGAGGDAHDPAIADAGAALELLHAFALLHDDVMDGSAARRGRPTAHRAFAAEHEARGWRGESRRFGEGAAILAGDLAFAWADELLLSAPLPARRLWTELRVELALGQYLDVLGAARGSASAAQALRTLRYKSGKYTIERPLHLGAAVAGRLDELAGPLSAVGLPLGDAFQLRDDLLGAFGDEAMTGKPVGDDIREGKPTLLRALAADRATGADADALASYGRPDLDDAGVARVRDALVSCGAAAEVERLVEALCADADAAIDALPFDAEARGALHELAAVATRRDR
jgi:geranylgeranyl diphosphate synthase type I